MQSSETASDSQKGPAARRGKPLPPIQTSFDSKIAHRLQRPRPVEKTTDEKAALPVSQAPALGRRSSKGGLLSLFSRNKSAKRSKLDADLTPTKEQEGDKVTPAVEVSALSPKTRRTAATQNVPDSARSQEKLPSDLHHKSSKSTARSKPIKKDRSPRTPITWDPPPLFQAYPQAVKHAELAALTMPAEAVLRNENHKRSSSSKRESAHVKPDSDAVDARAGKKEAGEKVDVKHTRRGSGSLPKTDWTRKIYVLVTSGFLLQYAGEGNFDRLPEKIMRLGKESAAFASDAISGKHWVLQISQATDEEGKFDVPRSKSVFAKFGFWSDMKRSVSCFLLVLDSPDEMNSWLVAMRKEIEALGGKKYQPDIKVRKASEEANHQLRERPSRRYLIQRDPNQFTKIQTPTEPLLRFDFGDAVSDGGWTQSAIDTSSLKSTRRQSLAIRRSTEAPSTANTTLSSDHACLDRLRESSRLSSTSAKTQTSSPRSSPLPSPARADFLLEILPPRTDDPPLSSWAGKSRRRSMQTLPTPVNVQRKSLDLRPAPKSPRPHSVLSSPPLTPNFSAPSFSKRYSQSIATPTMFTPLSSNATEPKSSSPATESGSKDVAERPTSTIGDLSSAARNSPKASRSRVSTSGTIIQPSILKKTNSHTSQSHVSSSSSSRPIPRRYSSLEYSLGKMPSSSPLQIPSPHPPPTTALPPVPGIDVAIIGSQISRPSSAPSSSSHKLRRPTSMQVRSEPVPRLKRISSQAMASTPSLKSIPTSSVPSPPHNEHILTHRDQHRSRLELQKRQSTPQFGTARVPPTPPPPIPVPSIPTTLLRENAPHIASIRGPTSFVHIDEIGSAPRVRVS
ncbi:hypothetical protein MMC06_002134 [Schaereria dolodes]|nr:hypothetical protein [Schaereria dolodes]